MTLHEHWTTPKPPADNPDAALLAMNARYRDLLERAEKATEEESDDLLTEAFAIEHEMARTPAYTFAGLHAKMEIAADNQDDEEKHYGDVVNLFSVLADLRRLAGGNVVPFPK